MARDRCPGQFAYLRGRSSTNLRLVRSLLLNPGSELGNHARVNRRARERVASKFSATRRDRAHKNGDPWACSGPPSRRGRAAHPMHPCLGAGIRQARAQATRRRLNGRAAACLFPPARRGLTNAGALGSREAWLHDLELGCGVSHKFIALSCPSALVCGAAPDEGKGSGWSSCTTTNCCTRPFVVGVVHPPSAKVSGARHKASCRRRRRGPTIHVAGSIRCPGSSASRAASGMHSLVRWHGELPTQATTQARGVGVHRRSHPRRGGDFAHRGRYAEFTSNDPLRIA